jgi:hypothetical protein
MIIVYLFATVLGALATPVILWSFGWSVALFCAPLGASAFALVIGSLAVRAQSATSRPAASAA